MGKKQQPDKKVAVGSSSGTKRGRQPAGSSWFSNYKQLGTVVAILIVSFICFSPALSSKKEFTNWDDPTYITEQKLITKLDGEHIKMMFSPQHDVSLNYHPLTILSLAINYHFSQLHPFGYFFTNILIHLLNTLLVFIFLYRLTAFRIGNSGFGVNLKSQTSNFKPFAVGVISALLFGIHPMHVESVAWASERKDVLYCFFFLASCITYLKYFETKQIKYLIGCFILFLLSCLSKAMAVPLPAVLLLMDYYLKRKFSLKSAAEKIPFFLLALWIGYVAVHIQSKEAIAEFKTFTVMQRFMFASYGFIMYWVKLFLPVNLSTFYPYPSLTAGEVPLLYKISPVILLIIVAVPLYIAYKKNKETFRLLLFGIGFFFVMVALVLQFLSVGAAIMADRYSYVSYIGVFFIIAMLVSRFFERKETKAIATSAFLMVALLLSVTCYARVKIWNDTGVLFTNVIEQYPYEVEQNGNVVTVKKVGVNTAYKNRGNFYRDHGDMDKAFADYNLLVMAHVQDEGAYNNMGNFYGLKGQEALSKGNRELANQMFSKGLEMYSEAIKLRPGNFETMLNRGITYSSMGDHQKALDDFVAALRIDPGAINLYGNLAFEKLQLGMYNEALEDCNHLLAEKPNDANCLMYSGTAHINLGKYKEAVNDLTQSLKINPAFGNGWYNLSFAYSKLGNKQEALSAALNAKKYGYAVGDQYLQELQR